jgi:sigma-B regulation protein RsbU (phosphoserine phosphatase)
VLVARVSTQVALKKSVEQIYRLERGLEQRNRELGAANARMQSDLVAAAKIQQALLPTVGPKVEGYAFAWLFEPSAGLAGDILNVFWLDEHKVGAYVLDVSGHGVAAALLSVTASWFLSASPDPSSMLWRRVTDAVPGGPTSDGFKIETPRRVAERLSQRFPFDTVTGQYFTMVYGLLDIREHSFCYTSAGHPNVIVINASGQARVLDVSGYPIGVGPGDYEEQAFALAPGDRLYIHTDGITEAMSPSEELFGTPRMLDLLREARQDTLEVSLKVLSEAIVGWAKTSERRDDQTVLAIERER